MQNASWLRLKQTRPDEPVARAHDRDAGHALRASTSAIAAATGSSGATRGGSRVDVRPDRAVAGLRQVGRR